MNCFLMNGMNSVFVNEYSEQRIGVMTQLSLCEIRLKRVHVFKKTLPKSKALSGNV